MTLDQLLSKPLPPLDILRGYWLVFDAALAAQLDAAQDPNTACRAQPIMLTNGRMALCADLLTEVSGGVFTEPFSKLNPELFPLVDVIEDEEFRSLIPPTPDDP